MPKTKKDIETEVEIELKKESPNAYPFMKGLSPITHLRRYLKTKKLESEEQKSKSIRHKDLYIGSPKRMETETDSEFNKRTKKLKHGGMIKARGNKLARSKPTKIC